MPLLRDIGRNGARIHELTEKLVAPRKRSRRGPRRGPQESLPANMRAKPMQFMVAREIYKHLERITDAFEDVANEIDGIVIDHA